MMKRLTLKPRTSLFDVSACGSVLKVCATDSISIKSAQGHAKFSSSPDPRAQRLRLLAFIER